MAVIKLVANQLGEYSVDMALMEGLIDVCRVSVESRGKITCLNDGLVLR